MKTIIQSLKAYVVFTVLLGLVYPLGITLIAQSAAPDKANGSLIKKDGQVIGSGLIGQEFTGPEYFRGRPLGPSNLGPSSKKLMETVSDITGNLRKENGLPPGASVPADMALASASGLDPHISIENAAIQAKRVARLRKIPENEIVKLIDKNTENDFLGIWGRPGINVLKLNMELDEWKRKD